MAEETTHKTRKGPLKHHIIIGPNQATTPSMVVGVTIAEAVGHIMATLGKSNDEANAMLEMIKHNDYAIHLPETNITHQSFITWPKN